MWDPQLDALEERFTVIRYDSRGHGVSPVPAGPYSIDALADDVILMLDNLDIEVTHFVGLSLGGMVGMNLAARYPERVDRMVVLCTSAKLVPAIAWHDRAARVRAHGMGEVLETVISRWFTRPVINAPSPSVQANVERLLHTPREGYAGSCEAIAQMDLTDCLPKIQAPTLAIAGADDPATPPSHLKAIAESVQAGSLLTIHSAAHLANVEQPEAVTAAVLDHLGEK
jgi:3-oxoadipate enol-lactonase